VTITVEDFGFDDVLEGLEQLDGSRIETGLHEPKEALKGVIHEFGSPVNNIPARPWLSVAADTGSERLGAAMGKAVGAVADGADPESALKAVGLLSQNIVRDVIVSGKVGGPPLAASTVDAKGSTKKLVDSGDMVRAIRSEVEL
jgi:hypothetical protein